MHGAAAFAEAAGVMRGDERWADMKGDMTAMDSPSAMDGGHIAGGGRIEDEDTAVDGGPAADDPSANEDPVARGHSSANEDPVMGGGPEGMKTGVEAKAISATDLTALILTKNVRATPQRIIESITSLAASEILAEGLRMPTVRELAKSMSISPASVSSAYHALSRAGVLGSRGRAGTYVLPQSHGVPRDEDAIARTQSRTGEPLVDLSKGTPDLTLLPDIRPFLGKLGSRKAFVNSYDGPTILPLLETTLRRAWPYEPEAMTMVSGAGDGLAHTLGAFLGPGDLVIVESPSYPMILDMIEMRGAVALGVPMDGNGMIPAALDRALAMVERGDGVRVSDARGGGVRDGGAGPEDVPGRVDESDATAGHVGDRAGGHGDFHIGGEGFRAGDFRAGGAGHVRMMVIQPRAQNPTGASMDDHRVGEIAAVLRRHYGEDDMPLIVEDDHSGDVANAYAVSLGRHIPGHVIHIRSFSKSHGPDLRLAALSGPARMVGEIVARRRLGSGWVSRFLQEILYEMLTDRQTFSTVLNARHAYATRQRTMGELLRRQGLDVRVGDGLNIWVPVRDEVAAVRLLARHSIRVAAGAPFRPRLCVGVGAGVTAHGSGANAGAADGADGLASGVGGPQAAADSPLNAVRSDVATVDVAPASNAVVASGAASSAGAGAEAGAAASGITTSVPVAARPVWPMPLLGDGVGPGVRVTVSPPGAATERVAGIIAAASRAVRIDE